MTKIRIGVTGSGFMGRTHVDAAQRLESTEIVGRAAVRAVLAMLEASAAGKVVAL